MEISPQPFHISHFLHVAQKLKHLLQKIACTLANIKEEDCSVFGVLSVATWLIRQSQGSSLRSVYCVRIIYHTHVHMIKRNVIIMTLVVATNSTITTATTTSTRWTIASALNIALYYAIHIYTNALISCLLSIHLMR